MTAPDDIQVPLGPLHDRPYITLPGMDSIETSRAMWRHALRGLELGAYDERIAAWVEHRATDQPSLIALASLLERARNAAVPQPGDVVERWLTGWIEDLKGSIGAASALRAVLADHQAHARHGVPLDQDIPLTSAGGDL